jgi:hypothetical protein
LLVWQAGRSGKGTTQRTLLACAAPLPRVKTVGNTAAIAENVCEFVFILISP